MTACVEGLLTHDGGCIGLGDRATIWPEGTAWDEQAQQLRLPSGESALIGDRISGGGGFLSVSHVRALFGDAVANACGDAEEVAVFNPGEPLAVTRA